MKISTTTSSKLKPGMASTHQKTKGSFPNLPNWQAQCWLAKLRQWRLWKHLDRNGVSDSCKWRKIPSRQSQWFPLPPSNWTLRPQDSSSVSKIGREFTPDSVYSKSRFNSILEASLTILLEKEIIRANTPGKEEDLITDMITLNSQLRTIYQGLENARLLPMILGFVVRPMIGEVIPAKDCYHPKFFGFGSRGNCWIVYTHN